VLIRLARLLAPLAVLLLLVSPAHAGTYEALLDDLFPTSNPRSDLNERSYLPVGVESLPAGSSVKIEEGSLQWGRIEDRLVLPRVRVRVEIPGATSGNVTIRGRSTPFRIEGRSAVAELLVPLVSGKASEFSVRWGSGRSGSQKPIRLVRVDDGADRFSVDPSCSSSFLGVRRRNPPADGASARSASATFDCRWIREGTTGRALPVLDLAVHWDGEDDSLRANGSDVPAVDPSIFRLRLSPRSESVVIETRSGDAYEIHYRLPPEANLGFVGLGLGPYHYRLLGAGADVATFAPLFTIYGSYQLAETARLTAFNATTLHRHFFSDTGVYIKTDSFRFFDQRIGVYLMLGANFYGFKFDSGTRFKTGLPQGFEATIRDFLRPNRNLTAGAFVYPPIEGKSYYNLWLRYGSAKFFGEVNYLRLRDRFDDQWIQSRNVGLSVGFPIARLF
jgi:hypothetical protein